MSAPLGSDYRPGPAPASTSLFKPVGVKTGNYTLGVGELALFDASAATLTAMLPSGAPVGSLCMAKRVDPANTDPANTYSVNIVPPSGETIRNGLTTSAGIPLTGQDQSRWLVKEAATQWTALVDDPLPSLYPRFPRLLYTQTSVKSGDMINAATVGTTETAFASQYTFPANSLVVGQTIEIKGAGVFTVSTAGPSQRPRIRLGSSLLVDVGALSLLANTASARYNFDCLFTVRSLGATGTLECCGELSFVSAASGQATTFLAGPSGVGGETTNPVTVNTTVANSLALSTQYSAGTAGNTNQLRQLMVSSFAPASGSS